MKTILSIIRVAALGCVLASAANLQAQTTTRTMTMVTAPFVFKGQQTAAGLVSDNTYFATFSGQAENTLNSRTRDTVSFTIQYVVINGVGAVSGGSWNLTELIKDRPPFMTGGAITPGAVVAVFANGSLAPGQLSLNFEAGDPTWPVSAVFNGPVDKSRPPKIDNASMLLTYPVVQ
jgi:hypothetical protein